MATRSGRKDRFCDPCAYGMKRGYYSPFLSILCNNVQIYGAATEDVPPTYIIRTLVERGGVAYIRDINQWAAYTPWGRLRRTGFPRFIRLRGDSGRLSSPLLVGEGAKTDNICVIPANAYFYPPEKIIQEKVDSLFHTEDAIFQNMDALRQCSAIFYDNPTLETQIRQAEEDRLAGKRTVHLLRKTGQRIDIEDFSPNAQNYLTELLAVRAANLEELDASTGRVTIGEKTERRTDDEVSVIENSACSTIDTIIDTFNRYCKWYGIAARAERGVEIRQEPQQEENGQEPEEAEEEPQGAQSGGEEGE